jgi:hypothetical protein
MEVFKQVTTYYISYRKWRLFRKTIRVEFAIAAMTKQEARTIADREARGLKGYRFQGVN